MRHSINPRNRSIETEIEDRDKWLRISIFWLKHRQKK